MQAEVGFDLDSIMTQRGAENFPVVLRAVPARPRAHLLAVYGFARLVDDIGDEYDGDRLAALDWVEEELGRVRRGGATHPVMVQLTPLLTELDIDDEPFLALIEANRLDQLKHRYQTQAELAEYCTLSANPVGRLVLAIFDAATAERIALSDAVCTGLQLVEHLQDIREDYVEKGRIYFPADEMARFGVDEDDLAQVRATEQLRRLVAHQCDAARGLLSRGDPLVASLTGWAKMTVAGYAAGGLAALDAIAGADYDVLAKLRTPTKARTAAHAIRLVTPRSVTDAKLVRAGRDAAARWRRK
ncbi:squalene synthase HpnC [Candidatus Poriferisocius sp.]|uniref:squalene synthase HpnC n=1 Tax=Candidatus Poriferisocius sp. TaxID=3101276 RepID=UPI003B01439F